ncbi:hypothetical protein ES703_58660 [subsurface metagenome]
MVTNNSSTGWLTSKEALQLLFDMGVGKLGAKTNKEEALAASQEENWVVPLSEKQWQNWVGSGKVSFVIENGQRLFDEAHIREVAQGYIDSNGRAYSIYHYDRDSDRTIEFINSYQCGQLWSVKDRQAQNIIASGKVPNSLMVGNEYYVDRQEAVQYQATQQLPSNAVPTHQDTR